MLGLYKWANNAEGQRDIPWGPERREKGCHFKIRTRLNAKRTVYCGEGLRGCGSSSKGEQEGGQEEETGFLTCLHILGPVRFGFQDVLL